VTAARECRARHSRGHSHRHGGAFLTPRGGAWHAPKERTFSIRTAMLILTVSSGIVAIAAALVVGWLSYREYRDRIGSSLIAASRAIMVSVDGELDQALAFVDGTVKYVTDPLIGAWYQRGQPPQRRQSEWRWLLASPLWLAEYRK
jgi:hypothetical protein